MKSIKINIIFNVIKSLSSLVFPLITFTYITHIFQPDGMGKIDFALTYMNYFVMFAMLGIVNYATREGAKCRNNKIEISKLAHEILFINICTVIISLLIYIWSLFFMKSLLPYRILLIIYSINIPLTALGLDWLYSAIEDYKYIALRSCIIQVLALVFTLIFVKSKDDIFMYALITVFSTCSANVLNFIYSRKIISYKWIGNYKIKKHIKSIVILFGMTICVQIFSHVDTIMLGFMVNDIAVGLYSAGIKMSNTVVSLIVAVTAVLAPRISYYYKKGQWNTIQELSYSAIDCILLLSVPATMGLFVLAKELILIFNGKSYLMAVCAAKIVSFRVLLSPLNTFIMVHFSISIDKEKNNVVTAAAAAIGNIVLNFFLIPYMAQDGAALATVCAELIELFICVYLVKDMLNFIKAIQNLYQYVIGAACIFVMYNFFTNYLTGIKLVLLLIPSSIFVYIVVLLLFKNERVKYLINWAYHMIVSYLKTP